MGDLNGILYSHEKEGCNSRPQNYMQAFQQVLDDCHIQDMGFVGDMFTFQRIKS
jgi:hypothetical protein